MSDKKEWQEWWWKIDHSCQEGEVDKCKTKEEAEKWGIEDFTHVIEYAALEELQAELSTAKALIGTLAKTLERAEWQLRPFGITPTLEKVENALDLVAKAKAFTQDNEGK